MAHKLLLADDSVTIQRVIALTFAEEDVEVIAVSDGQQAIDRMDADPPDIVLADVDMPKRDGYEVAAYVKSRPQLAHIPVVLLTGAFEPVDQARATASGSSDVLTKPFEPQMVINRVKELLGKKRYDSPGTSQTPPTFPVQPARSQPARASQAPEGEPSAAPKDAAGPVSLDDYFDQLDAAFAIIQGGGPGAPASAGPAPSKDHSLNDEFDWITQPPPPGAPNAAPALGSGPPVQQQAQPVAPKPPAPAPAPAPPTQPPRAVAAPPPPSPQASAASAKPSVSHAEAQERSRVSPDVPHLSGVAPAAPARQVPPPAPPPSPPAARAPVAVAPAARPAAPPAASAKGPASLDEAQERSRAPKPAPAANPFAALSAAAKTEVAAVAGPVAITDEVIEEVCARVLSRLSDQVVRETVAQIVSQVAEQLVREEIERIKTGQ